MIAEHQMIAGPVLTEIFALQAKCKANIFATSRFILEVTRMFDGSTSLEILAME